VGYQRRPHGKSYVGFTTQFMALASPWNQFLVWNLTVSAITV
jgi:hypothetical protein